MRRTLAVLCLALTPPAASAQAIHPPAALKQIRQADLQRDMYALAGDAMRGREAGTVDEMRASAWLAEEMRKIGVTPKGDAGSWYQWWSMKRTRLSSTTSSVKLGDQALALWTDVVPTSNVTVDAAGPTMFVSNPADTTVDVRGKIVIVDMIAPQASAVRTTTNTYEVNYTRPALAASSATLARRGALAVVVIADSIGEIAFEGIAKTQVRGTYDVVGGVPRFTRAPANGAAPGGARGGVPPRPVPILLAHQRTRTQWAAVGQTADIRLRTETFETPSVNVIGMVRGTDAKLRDEYVVFSSHQDHDGVRFPVNGDSIWNGADDNASTSVALLAIARAWVKQPSKRSALFIFHGAEERGLLGSRYHVAHPVVPLDRMVAVLNGDMIGRNNPDTAALLGSQPPHRNSAALVKMAIDANAALTHFAIDSSWDRPTHPEGWYFRSDHVPYAEKGVPSLFFSTNLHSDYHTPRDEPKNIDYPKLTRMTEWMYLTGWIAANAAARPAVDPGFVLR